MATSYNDTNTVISILNVLNKPYNLKDAEGRRNLDLVEARVTTNESDIATLKAAVTDGAHFRGKVDTSEGKTTPLDDGSHTAQIFVVGKTDKITDLHAGDFVIQSSGNVTREFIWDGIASPDGAEVTYTGTWREMGSTGALKAFAFADTGSVTVKLETSGGVTDCDALDVPADNIQQPVFTGKLTQCDVAGTFSGEGDAPEIDCNEQFVEKSKVTITEPTAATQDTPSNETLGISIVTGNVVESVDPEASKVTIQAQSLTISKAECTPDIERTTNVTVRVQSHGHAHTIDTVQDTFTVSPVTA